MSQLILHHYDFSPFSEKIRLIFGLKNLSWRSVVVPAYMPKPDLLPLTGGYRHTPVLQVGADIFCDTRLISAEIERRHPDPPLWTSHTEGFSRVIEAWAERDLFWPIARYASGTNAERLDPELHQDRAAMRSKPAPSLATLQAVARRSLGAARVQIRRVESMLCDGRAFLLGASPGLADLAVYHGLWFLKAMPIDCSGELAPYPRIGAWMSRVAAIGHGTVAELDPKQALRVAAEADPEAMRASVIDETAPPLGSAVAVRPEDYSTEPVVGELVLVTPDEIALRRRDPVVGTVVIHFPRIGYSVKGAA